MPFYKTKDGSVNTPDFADELGLTVVNIPVVDFEELDELLITVDEELVVLPAEDLSVVEDEPIHDENKLAPFFRKAERRLKHT